ncbi:MAG TPA: arginine decarboxylase, pyruvoyl-dependent [Candidatus Altiarchaeales archaeon]|nr:arginine decarboxylase, pyruvoyl-dependent [Candidatus Altiarchaeales archaeon]
MIPRKLFFTKGVGKHKEKLQSFEMALRDAKIAQFNLVNVSSIVPPGCRIIPREEGLKYLKPGQIVFCVMSQNCTNEPNRLIVSSVGSAIPNDENSYGYLSEHHSFGQTEEKAGIYVEDLAATMLAQTLGIEMDADKAWDEREKIYKISGKTIKSSNITQSAVGDKNGKFVTTIAAAVFVMD